MDIKTLRYFVAVAETGSFSAASRGLRVAQPALSRQVRQLEAQLGTKLLTRSPTGVATTEAGERLLRFGLGLVHQFDRVPAVVNAKGQPVSGQGLDRAADLYGRRVVHPAPAAGQKAFSWHSDPSDRVAHGVS